MEALEVVGDARTGDAVTGEELTVLAEDVVGTAERDNARAGLNESTDSALGVGAAR